MMDPHARQRTTTTTRHAIGHVDLSNDELLQRFTEATRGNLSPAVIDQYAALLRDAVRYFRTPEGSVPVREWTKNGIGVYLDFVENNYCSAFRMMNFPNVQGAKCSKRAWEGVKPAEEAIRMNCSGCVLFQQPDAHEPL